MSRESPNWVSAPAHVEALVQKWRGGSAQGWSYSVSHAQLLIRVQRESDPVDLFSLFLLFKDCSRISFQTLWRGFDLKIERIEGELGPELEATDSDRLSVRFRYGPFARETDDFIKLHGI